MRLLAEGRTLAEIAHIRARKLSTVISLVAEMIERGDVDFDPAWLAPEKRKAIEVACRAHGTERLRPLKEALPAEISYEEIRLVVAHLRRLT